MMIDARLAAVGIPDRYVCDDDYFCFALLRPGQPDPKEEMALVPAALCFHTVGGSLPEVYRRVRRSLFSSHVMQADFPLPVSNFYFCRIQFYGLWPMAPLDRSRSLGYAIAKWLLKAIYFAWYAEVGGELFVRGLLGRPLRQIAWSAYLEYEVPATLERST